MSTSSDPASAAPIHAARGSEILCLSRYSFKRAETAEELEQVHRLNYRTFVREIPQHADPGSDYLVDKFHDKNEYFIALRAGRVVGMVAAHDRPPFSVTDRLSDPKVLERLGSRLMEVRLLAVEPGERHGMVFAGLTWVLYEQARHTGFTHVVISGVADRQALYEGLGFRAVGPRVESGGAWFVPMVLALGELPEDIRRNIARWQRRIGVAAEPVPTRSVCLMPGPVQVSDAVRDAFGLPSVSHRSPGFVGQFERTRRMLSDMVGGLDTALLVGSGTLANDVVAAALAARRGVGPGILLANGEFGERLARQATRAGLDFQLLRWPWGESWNMDEVTAALAAAAAGWIWAVHLESSTGMLNDLPGLVALARTHNVRLCVDCVSSLGAVPLDLGGVYLASGVSGKALGAYAGIAIVFAAPGVLEHSDWERVPTYLDLHAALATVGPRFTCPSPELQALDRALESYTTPAARRERYEHYASLGRRVRAELRPLGIDPITPEPWAAPTVTTFAPPQQRSSGEFVDLCQNWGFEIGGLSEYLRERRLVQIGTMGAVTWGDCAPLFDELREWLKRPAVSAGAHRAVRIGRRYRQRVSSA